MSSKTKLQIQENLLKTYEKDLTKCFDQYRKIGSINRNFRKQIFDLMKNEIINSLNYLEKITLVNDIQQNMYQSEIGKDYYVPNSQYTEISFNNELDFFLSDEAFIPRSSTTKENDLDPSLDLDECLDSLGFEEINSDSKVVVELFNRITGMIDKDDQISYELEDIKTEYGDEVYRNILKYIPKNARKDNNKVEPIIFQLALKGEKYESILEKLHQENLLDLNQKNQFNMTIFNVLLLKSFHMLCYFFGYLERKGLTSHIKFILSYEAPHDKKQKLNLSADFKNMFLEENSAIAPVEENKNCKKTNSSKCSPGERFLIGKGIVYCRNQIKDKNSTIIKELNEKNILHVFLNEEIENEKCYLSILAEKYSKLKDEVDKILKENYSVIVDSPFFVLLARQNLKIFHNFLKRLIPEFNVDKILLYKACVNKNINNESVESIINSNANKFYEEDVKEIQKLIYNLKSLNK